MKSGIYRITNKINNKIYIGQSVDVNRRIKDHKRALKKGIHNNVYLQREFDKYGACNFDFSIVQRCPVDELDRLEIETIKSLNCMDNKKGYNMEGGGNKNKIVSLATRMKKMGKNNPMYGKKLPKHRVEQMRIRNRGNSDSLSEDDVRTIKHRLLQGEMNSAIAKDYNVVNSTIDKIANGTNWYWVEEETNEKIRNLKEQMKVTRDEKIYELEKEGIPRCEIAKIVNCTPATVTRVLKTGGFDSYRERYKQIEEDYIKGLDKSAIIEKYKISNSTYTKAISKVYNERKQKMKERAIEMRKNGVMVKEIAEELGFARTTITKWTLQSS